MKDDYIDILISKPYILNEKSIERICNSLAKAINCRLEEIDVRFDKSKGYYFYGPYQICVADLLYEFGEYRGVQVYSGVIEDLKVQLEEERIRIAGENRRKQAADARLAKEQERKEKRDRRNRYIIQKYVVPGVAITLGGVVVLTTIGAIHKAVTKEPAGIVQQAPSLNTVANASDLILFEWANYAMNQLSNVSDNSEHDSIKTMIEGLRTDYFTPIMSSYYAYVEEEMLDLPHELTGESIKTNHNSFRNKAYLFDEEIQDRGFKSCSFVQSPFANAIVVDAYGKIIEGTESGLFGEVYDSNGELLTLDSDMGYIIYIRAQDVVGNDYGTSNYPEDAIMYKGVAYVNSSHLYDFEAPNMGSK